MDPSPLSQPEVLLKNKSSLFKKIAPVLFLVALILIGSAYFILKFSKFSPLEQTENKTEIPVSLGNPAVFSFALAYNFHATLKEIKDLGNNQKLLVTSIDSPDMPQFIVTQETKLFIDQKNVQVEIPVSLLKKDSRISIIASYIPRTKKWEVTKVRVLKN